MPLRKKTSPFWNVALVLVLVLAFAYLAYLTYAKPSKVAAALPIPTVSAQEQHDALVSGFHDKYYAKTMAYVDPDYGFKMRYPIGYAADVDPVPGVRLRFSAFYPPLSSEILDVRVLNASDLDAQSVRDSAAQANATALELEQNGRPLFLVNLQQPDPSDGNQSVTVREAFYACPDKWLVFTAALSEPLAPDAELADYMISTMEC